MRRALTLAVAVLLALQSFAVVAKAADIESCSQGAYDVWEYANYAGDGLHVCYPVNFANLALDLHLQAGLCFTFAGTKTHDDWDNCLSSGWNRGGSETHYVCFYTGTNFTGQWIFLVPGG